MTSDKPFEFDAKLYNPEYSNPGSCSIKSVYLKVLPNSQEIGFRVYDVIKKRLQHRCLPVNFAIFLRKLCLQNTFLWLCLKIMNSSSYLRVLPIVGTNHFFYRNLLTISPSASTLVEHFY